VALVLSGWCKWAGKKVRDGRALLVWCFGYSGPEIGCCDGTGLKNRRVGKASGCCKPSVWRLSASWVVLVMGNGTLVLCLAGSREEKAAKAVEPWCSVVLWHTGESDGVE